MDGKTLIASALLAAILAFALSRPIQAQKQLPPAEITPADVRLTIHDLHDLPIEGVRITLTPKTGEQTPIAATTDQIGRAMFTIPLADQQAYGLTEDVLIEKEGMPKYKASIGICDAAQIRQTYLLQPSIKTIIHLRGPKGEPIEGVPLQLPRSAYSQGLDATGRITLSPEGVFEQHSLGPMTDQHGDYSWNHTPMAGALTITIGGGWPEPIAVVNTKMAEDVTITLAGEALSKVYPTRILEGRLLLADGSPASNWFIAQHVVRRTGGGSNMGPLDRYQTESISHPAADGLFNIHAPGNFLGLISPEGYQFIYAINPAGWAGGIHRLSLVVPAIKSTAKFQLVDQAGNPLPGVPVRPTWMHAGGYGWELQDITAWGGGVAGNVDWKMTSDDKGWITFPDYFGAQADPSNFQFGNVFPKGGYMESEYSLRSQFGISPQITLALTPRTEVAPITPGRNEWNHLILAFVDTNGTPIYDAHIDEFKPIESKDDLGQPRFIDAAGMHYFVDRAARWMSLKTTEGAYKPLRQEITPAAEPLQRFTFHLERNKPLTGQVLDNFGKPLAGTRISLAKKVTPPPNSGLGNRDSLNLVATADDTGHFEFPGAPDNCIAGAFHQNPETNEFDTSMVETNITPENRSLTIRLTRTGSVRVLLPELALAFTNYAQPLRPNDPASKSGIEMRMDHAANILHASGVIPGTYHLDPEATPTLGDMSALPIEIKSGEETIVDLHNKPVPGWAGANFQPLTLAIEQNGKPFSGAEVILLADALPAEAVLRRYEAWRKATTDADIRSASSKLQETAGLALDLLPLSDKDPAIQTRLTALRTDLEKGRDDLAVLAMDVSDAVGLVHFAARQSQPCIAIARVRGQLIGWHSITISDKEAPPIKIPLQPLRPAIVHITSAGTFPILTPLDSLAGLERRAVLRALNVDHLWQGPGARSGSPITQRQTGDLVINPLPVGATFSLSWPTADPIKITIAPGEGPMEIKLP